MSNVQPLTTLQYLALIHEVSYAKLCKDIGVTPQQFTDWVKKRRPIPKERLDKIAQYFEVEASELIEENFYLQELTELRKSDIQIAFLRKKLSQQSDPEEQEVLREKLEYLSREKEHIHQINRFAKAYEQGSENTRKLCRTFLNKIEQGHEDQLAPILED